jgi:hypothetical protein
MIKVIITDKQRNEIAYALKHHANRLDVMHARLIQRLHLSTVKGEFTTWSSGPNSHVLYLSNGESWYFSGRPEEGEIRVRYGGIPFKQYATYVLKTRKDVDQCCDGIGF